ncbi:MAG: hypothetical protein HYT15_02460 [Candidatus Magasanikbacteria bacterium]|nr:hypothetical protein [Candidatus Magasanikbacteria bacterium]
MAKSSEGGMGVGSREIGRQRVKIELAITAVFGKSEEDRAAARSSLKHSFDVVKDAEMLALAKQDPGYERLRIREICIKVVSGDEKVNKAALIQELAKLGINDMRKIKDFASVGVPKTWEVGLEDTNPGIGRHKK